MGDQTDIRQAGRTPEQAGTTEPTGRAEQPEQTARTVPAGALVGVVGAGTMGVGVAQCFAEAGHPDRKSVV